MRDPAWSPDGTRLAVVVLDRIWTMRPDGRDGTELTKSSAVEREPAWSPDGKRIAFAADRGEGFDLYVVHAPAAQPGQQMLSRPRQRIPSQPRQQTLGVPERVAALEGDERWPSWTRDGWIVFAHRAADATQWDLFTIDPDAPIDQRTPLPLTQSPDDEVHPHVSPDGRRLAFASNRGNDEGDFDIWLMPLLDRSASDETGAFLRLAVAAGRGHPPALRFARLAGYEGHPTWSPDGTRLAYYAVRDGLGSTWVAGVAPVTGAGGEVNRAAFAPGASASAPRTSADTSAPRPVAPPVLASRHGGTIAWSPDGQTLAIGEIPEPEPSYNGNPQRDPSDPPALFGLGHAYQLWTVPAPRMVDEGERSVGLPAAPAPAALTRAFDSVWGTLKRLYYDSGGGSAQWEALRAEYRPRADQARTPAALEDVVDQMVAEQPLVRPVVTSSRAIVVSAHPLASEAGREVLEQGGSIVDAAIAVSFALGVVEPDASGIGGDGQAVLFLKGMSEPTVIEFKDQTPRAATLDAPGLLRNGRLPSDGPMSVNIPGVVAGLDYLYTKYGSGRVSWADLVAPAIKYADDGFVLDATLPSTVAEGRPWFQKYTTSSRIYLPRGRVPRVGERFVNREYAATLRTIASEGAQAFYRGSIAKRIAADMLTNGGLITEADLAQYRAIERKPVSGRYRGHLLYTGGPPVSAGVSLIEALQILGSYRPRPRPTVARDAEYWHYLIESWKARDRIARIADPAQWSVDFDEHLQPSHAAELFARIRRDSAARFSEDSEEMAGGPERIGSGTSGFVVADADGNMIAVTQTLSTWGGSFYATRGLGFLYNNHLRLNRTTPGVYGQLMPWTRSNTVNLPLLAFRSQDGQPTPAFAVASAGNAWIPASTYSIVTAVIDGGQSMQQAVEAPRFLVARDPADPVGTGARVEIEDRFPRAVLKDLITRGHRFRKVGRKGELRYGYASGVLVDTLRGRVEGGADPRRSHAAVAVDGGATISQ
jgi:gamma-glutamyltranspeptidase